MFSNQELMQRDIKNIWHPCTQMKDHEKIPIIPIKFAKGVYLFDFDGNKYIDAISSWWVNIFGHSNEYINNRIKNQLDMLEHVILAGFTHEPAIILAEKLVKITPNGLNKVFYADNGSSSVEIALKMSFHYHLNNNEKRTIFLSLTNSYHGETIGALSVGDVELYKKTYEPLLLNCIQTPVPKDQSLKSAKDALGGLRKILEKEGKNISAFILEPLVQGAGSMHMYHEEYLIGARELTKEYGIHLIVDEIMTGFGRTGKMFACEYAGIEPDFMTLSKGLTGGYLPLSVVMTTDNVYSAFYCEYSEHKAFLHSHSYTGNTLACTAANATLEIFEEQDTIEKNKELSECMKLNLGRFDGLKGIKNRRILGMIAVVELEDEYAKERVGLKIYEYALSRGVLIRPLANTIYVMPPYVITKDELNTIFDVVYGAINEIVI